jgi:hypothetical protein
MSVVVPEPCPACGRAMKKRRRVFLESVSGIRQAEVCEHCYQSRRGVPLVTADEAQGLRALLAPFVRHFRKLARVYSLDGSEGRAAGLSQAADILEEGRAVVSHAPYDDAEHKPALPHAAASTPRSNGAAELEHQSSPGLKGARTPKGPIVNLSAADEHRYFQAATAMDREILRALCEREAPMDRRQIGIATGYSYRGGAFSGTMASLVRCGFVRRSGDGYMVTDRGVHHAAIDPLPTGPALLDFWCERLPLFEASILNCLAHAHPEAVERDRLGTITGYAPKGGAFSKAMSKLRALGLVEGWRASDALMQKAAAHG